MSEGIIVKYLVSLVTAGRPEFITYAEVDCTVDMPYNMFYFDDDMVHFRLISS